MSIKSEKLQAELNALKDVSDATLGDAIALILDRHGEELCNHYLSTNQMPYAVAKARDGDPDEWLFDQLMKEYGFS